MAARSSAATTNPDSESRVRKHAAAPADGSTCRSTSSSTAWQISSGVAAASSGVSKNFRSRDWSSRPMSDEACGHVSLQFRLLHQTELSRGVDDLAGDRRRGAGAVAGVLDDHREGDPARCRRTARSRRTTSARGASSTSAVPVLPAIGVALASSAAAGPDGDRLAHVCATASPHQPRDRNRSRGVRRAGQLVGGCPRSSTGPAARRRPRRSPRRRAPSSAATRARPPARSRRAAASGAAPPAVAGRAASIWNSDAASRIGCGRGAAPAARSRRCTRPPGRARRSTSPCGDVSIGSSRTGRDQPAT